MSNLINNLQSLPVVWALMIVGLTPLILATIGFFLRKHVVKWEHEERGFAAVGKHWKNVFYYSFIGGWGLSLLAGLLSEWNLYAILLMGIVSYVLIFSTITDLIVHKAPKEVSRYGIYAGAPVAILAILDFFVNRSGGLVNFNIANFGSTITEAQLWNFGLWMTIPVVLLIVGRGGVGMADIRLLILFGITMSWWVGTMGMFIAFFIANVLQILAFIPANKLNWGKMVTLKNGKEKRAVPFIPALTVAFLTVGLYSLYSF